ncbi:BamA/TamA family outer membrane protein, partial [Parabacteroides sp. OttesenSCG-928-G06]|nr:BamA/TamA family outer membrane protein [Parabacteroides sp. OttesenSCG-928-G06]
ALAYAPNNALFGSSTTRIPIPFGLWIYNGFKKYKGGVGKWIFDKFAAKPVLINTVNPDVRVAVARNMLRENGYFDGNVHYEILPDKKKEQQAKINYFVEMNHGYRYDSIQYMRMRHFADTLIHANMHKSLLRKGDQFNVIQLENERQRISSLLRDNGFYYYRPEFVVYEADTLLTPGMVWLQMKRKEGIPWNALVPYKIGHISVYMSGYKGEAPTDSMQYKDMTVYYEGKLKLRPEVLYSRLRFKPGDLYTLEEQQRTQTGLSRLNTFRYAEFQYAPRMAARDTVRRSYERRTRDEQGGQERLDSLRRRSALFDQNNLLDVRINTVFDYPYDGELEVNASTKSNDYTGPGALFTLTRRNAFHGGELLGFQVKGSYEWQTGNRVDGTKINSYELGANATLTMPFVLFPGFVYRDLVRPSSTTFKLSLDLINRARFFRMTSFGLNMVYDFRPTPTTRHQVTPFRLNFNKLKPTELFIEKADENPSLWLSLEDQFVPAMSYSFTYDNASVADRHYFSWASSFTQVGNIISAIGAIAGEDFNREKKSLLGNPYAQFVKATSELRYNYRIDKNNRLAGRLMLGGIYSYGNSRVAPYNEQFYIGGANSVRAFTIRSIGPGRYYTNPETNPYTYIDRTGDYKFEANLEYRVRLVGDLEGAIFLDAGGIWAARKDDREGAMFKAGEFFNDLALGTGAGLRYDLSFLLIRFDVGLGLHVPYATDKKGYFNIDPFKKGGYSWHLAVGYPF